MKRFCINVCIYLLRKAIVFLINILDWFKVKRGSYSYRHEPTPSIHIRELNDNKDVGVFINKEDSTHSIGRFITKDFKMNDTCLFDPKIEACLINQWLYTALPCITLMNMKKKYD